MLQPCVYSTNHSDSLLKVLDDMWIKTLNKNPGTIYIISGFANYNGGVRFYPYFSEYIHNGGKIVAIVGGSTAQKLSSQQVVEALLKCGADVSVVNRKRLLHAKCYGYCSENGEQELVVSSGNFTGPGMSQNAEAAIRINSSDIKGMPFSWNSLVSSIYAQQWDIYKPDESDIENKTTPVWKLLYDEVYGTTALDEDQEITMVLTLSHSDTVRIQANPGENAGKGTQYFWLSKGSFDFFPALTEKNTRGYKNTYSCTINVNYVDLDMVVESRVTFEADNNMDFRLGTAPYRYTKVAEENDLACLTRLREYDYELRIIKQDDSRYRRLLAYAVNFIGNRGKKFGYIDNSEFKDIMESETSNIWR